MTARKTPAKKAPVKRATPKAAAPKKDVDWAALEVRYRGNSESLRSLGAFFGVSEAAIRQHAKRHEWQRDLSKRIEIATDALLIRKTASRDLRTEADEVAVAAEMRTNVVLNHRADITRSRALLSNLMGELEAQTDNLDLFEQLGELLDETDTDDKGRVRIDKLNQIYRKVISTPGRVDSFKKLADVLAINIKLEREAFNIGVGGDEKTDVEEMLEAVGKKLGLTQ